MSGATTVQAFAASDNWSDSSVTWSTGPTIGVLLGSVDIPAVTGYQWYEIDVTDYIKSQLSSDSIASMALRETGGKLVSIASGDSSNGPRLLITLA